MNVPRSYLFVPADRPDRFAKALACGAGEVVIDLEDAVGPDAKTAAAATLRHWLEAAPATTKVCLRVNGAQTPWHASDMLLAQLPAVRAVMLPKAESAAMVRGVRACMPDGQALIALIETVPGLLALRDIAQSGAVDRLAFGSVDFCMDAGMQDAHGALDTVRTALTLESRGGGLPAPVDGVTVVLNDDGQIASDIKRSRALGFGAKLCIHPRQVGPVNAGYLPSQQERDWARRVMDAVARAGHCGAATVDGQLIDTPVIEQARRIVQQQG